ncbi:HAMP domain-containing sensor histidine kinase [Chryseobacterium sp.]|uniref:sensor histidine kinase n=1 Tax=Chryseobacterium sp. TaxID=1871047 RepID=UPI0025C09726|nr:HAMP domain-containing sensor histidine kinase [Chryseobacterium sp.]
MKSLLNKITKPFLVYVLIILLISIPVYYFVIDTIWINELDEHNEIVADKTAFEFNQLKLSDEELEKSIELWNHIQPGTDIEKVTSAHLKKNKIYTIEKQKLYSTEPNIDRFRCLKKIIYINQKPYLFTIETNVEETQETIIAIAITTGIFFLLIVIGLLLLNRRLSNTVWSPFNDTLSKLKSFDLSEGTPISFQKTDIKEFEELNTALSRLIEHNISVYKTQKEFTENASHELQTPLAILQNKIDNLLQDQDITENQYSVIEDLNKTLSRSTRINKNLLLLAKIGNLQFSQNEKIPLYITLSQSLEFLREHFDQKGIHLGTSIDEVEIETNRTLAETLINNLLVNTIRHTPNQGTVNIRLSKSSLEISNSGETPLNSDSLFKRFSKASSENSGSGLGLAIVKEICQHQHWALNYHFEKGFHFFSIGF